MIFDLLNYILLLAKTQSVRPLANSSQGRLLCVCLWVWQLSSRGLLGSNITLPVVMDSCFISVSNKVQLGSKPNTINAKSVLVLGIYFLYKFCFLINADLKSCNYNF